MIVARIVARKNKMKKLILETNNKIEVTSDEEYIIIKIETPVEVRVVYDDR